MGIRHGVSRLIVGCALTLTLAATPAAEARGTANLRFVQARAGAAARLWVVEQGSKIPVGGSTPFGQVTNYASVAAGPAKLMLTTGAGSAEKASLSQPVAAGKFYTVVALAKGSSGYQLSVYTDGSAKPGRAKIRVIHAAPELGSPDLALGHRTIAQGVHFRAATPYLTVAPGAYKLAVMKPGGKQVVFSQRITVSAGSSETAIIAGSAGEPERVILASDTTVAPAGAPKTGFGGLAKGGGTWLLAAIAAALAGALGGAVQLRRARRFRR
jgi:hypothetical protein